MCQALERTLIIYLNAMPNTTDKYLLVGEIIMEPNMPYGQEYNSL